MNQSLVDKIAAAVLYEGYILYPYRPALKNRQRWTIGGLYPRAYCEAKDSGDAWAMQTECLVHGGSDTRLQVKVRFLHERRLQSRQEAVERTHLCSEPRPSGSDTEQPLPDGRGSDLSLSALLVSPHQTEM